MKARKNKERYIGVMSRIEDAAHFLEHDVGLDKFMPIEMYVLTISVLSKELSGFANDTRSLNLISLAAAMKDELTAANEVLEVNNNNIEVGIGEVLVFHLHLIRDLEWSFYKDHGQSAMKFVDELKEEHEEE